MKKLLIGIGVTLSSVCIVGLFCWIILRPGFTPLNPPGHAIDVASPSGVFLITAIIMFIFALINNRKDKNKK